MFLNKKGIYFQPRKSMNHRAPGPLICSHQGFFLWHSATCHMIRTESVCCLASSSFLFLCSIHLPTRENGLQAELVGIALSGCPASQDQFRWTTSFLPAGTSLWCFKCLFMGWVSLMGVQRPVPQYNLTCSTFQVSDFPDFIPAGDHLSLLLPPPRALIADFLTDG